MSEFLIPVRLLGRDAVAEYQGTIYSQSVGVAPTDGDQISVDDMLLFDDSRYVTDGMIGDEVCVTVSIVPSSDVELLEEPITDVREPSEQISDWSYDFFGHVASIPETNSTLSDDFPPLLVLDIGIGAISVRPNSVLQRRLDEESLSIGDYIRITASRTNLASVGE